MATRAGIRHDVGLRRRDVDADTSVTPRGKDDTFAREDLLAVGRAFDVPKQGADIIDEVEAALGLWVPESQEAGLDPEWIARIQTLFRHFV